MASRRKRSIPAVAKLPAESQVDQAIAAFALDYAAIGIDRTDRITEWGRSAERLFGYGAEEVVGKSLRLLVKKGDSRSRPRRGPSFKRMSFQERLCRRNGSVFVGRCRFLTLERGVRASRILLIQDVTDQHRKEEECRALTVTIENSEDAVITKNLTGQITSFNRAATRLFGYERDEIIGKPITALIPLERRQEEKSIFGRIVRGKRVESYDTVRRRKDGVLVDVALSVSPIRGNDGKIIGAAKIVRDITQRKKSEAQVRRNEELLQAILNAANDAIITIDERGLIQTANHATERLFGFPLSELMGKNINVLMPQPYRMEHDGYIDRYRRTGEARIIGLGREVTGQRKNGETFPMNLSVGEAKLEGHRLFTGIVHDLTARRRLERQIIDVAASEQRRIGNDLHDGICQDLIGIAFGIDGLAQHASSREQVAAAERLAAAVREVAGQARQLSHGLNPVNLAGGGVIAALQGLAAKVSESFHVNCRFHNDGESDVTDDSTATNLYRIAQEAVGNSIRHGKATEVEIELARRDGGITLTVSDNGKGIAKSVAESQKKGLVVSGQSPQNSGGIGLQTMQYRAHVMGGSLSIEPLARRGTRVVCTVGRVESQLASREPKKTPGKIRLRKHPLP